MDPIIIDTNKFMTLCYYIKNMAADVNPFILFRRNRGFNRLNDC
jgi:hypothetical protein